MNNSKPASKGRNSRAKVVFPAPFGPAMMTIFFSSVMASTVSATWRSTGSWPGRWTRGRPGRTRWTRRWSRRPHWPRRRSRSARRARRRSRASLRFRFRSRAFFRFSRADGGDAFVDWDLQFLGWLFRVVEVGHSHARQSFVDGAFDGAQVVLFIRRDECDRVAGHLRARGAADAMNV